MDLEIDIIGRRRNRRRTKIGGIAELMGGEEVELEDSLRQMLKKRKGRYRQNLDAEKVCLGRGFDEREEVLRTPQKLPP